MRTQQLKERLTQRDQPLSELSSLMGMANPNKPEFGQFMGASNAGGTNSSTAAGTQYNAALSNYNAEQASKSANTAALMSILGQLGTSASTPGTPANDAYKYIFDYIKSLSGGSGGGSGGNVDTSGYPTEGDPYNPEG
jgi:hypothetical protein